jgi:hypothetical protein
MSETPKVAAANQVERTRACAIRRANWPDSNRNLATTGKAKNKGADLRRCGRRRQKRPVAVGGVMPRDHGLPASR